MRRIRTVTGLAAVTALASTLPAAHALTPPVIDNAMLPPAAAPAPPRPTVQHEPCAAHEVASAAHAATDVLSMESVWALTRGEGQRVAVIDTGVRPHHRLADLRGGGDYVSTGDGTKDCDGHGTLVAGIIAATPDLDDPSGFAGIAPAVTVLTIRQSSAKFTAADEPPGTGDVTTMAMAVRTAADLGATVINISTVACAAGPVDDGALGAALAYAVDVKNVVVVAAAGNVGGEGRCPRPPDGDESNWATATVVTSPGWHDDYVLTVGAVTADGRPSEFSLPGPWVDVAAPGEHVVSLHPSGSGVVDALPAFGRSMPISGTSYAAPVVSGVAALVRARFPGLTARQVMQRIEATARTVGPGWNPAAGHGVVDPVAALSAEPPAPTEPPRQPAVVATATGEPQQAADGGQTTALVGAGICAGLIAFVAVRSRRGDRDPVMGGTGR